MLILRNYIFTNKFFLLNLILISAAINSSFVFGCSCWSSRPSTRAERRPITLPATGVIMPTVTTEKIDSADSRFADLLKTHAKTINIIYYTNSSKKTVPMGSDIISAREAFYAKYRIESEELLLNSAGKPYCLIMRLNF